MCKIIPLLIESQILDVKSVGFGGILSLVNFSSVLWSLVMWFLENFNPSSRVLSSNNIKSFVIRPKDIEDLFSLPLCHESPVLIVKDEEEVKEFVTSLKQEYSEKVGQSLSGVCDLLCNGLRDGGEEFKIFFVLYALGSFLTPTMNRSIAFSVMKSLMLVDRIETFDWCSFVLGRLCKAVTSFRNNPSKKNINWCLLVLPLLYFHR